MLRILAMHRALDGGVEVGVVEDQERGVAAQLHRHPQDLLGGLLDQLAADLGRAGERQLAQRAGRSISGSIDAPDDEVVIDVEHAVGQARLVEDLGQRQHRQRGLLGRLHDHRAAGGDGRADLAGAHRHREVPGRDAAGTARPAGAS